MQPSLVLWPNSIVYGHLCRWWLLAGAPMMEGSPVGEQRSAIWEKSMSPPRRALVLVDVQQQYFSGPLEIQYPKHQESLPMIARAIDAANAAGIPVAAV